MSTNRGLLQRWPKRTIKERFEEKIYYALDGCWYWTACLNEKGYGEFAIGNNRKKLANRASFEIFKGPIPNGLFVCHSCDNPSCVNPDHLYAGDQTANMSDMVKRNRRDNTYLKGARNNKAKLTESQVLIIKAATPYRGMADDLSKKFGVSKMVIYGIRRGSQWTHLSVKESAKAMFVKV